MTNGEASQSVEVTIGEMMVKTEEGKKFHRKNT
jgi:hypothetical protein